jgi:ribosomal protein S7
MKIINKNLNQVKKSNPLNKSIAKKGIKVPPSLKAIARFEKMKTKRKPISVFNKELRININEKIKTRKALKKEELLALKPINNKEPRKTVYIKLLGSLIKKGNKTAAKRVLDNAFFIVAKKYKAPVAVVFTKIFRNLDCRIEMRKVKMRRNTHMVPFPIKTVRQDFVKIKWILKAVKEDTRKVPFSEKIKCFS